MSNCVRGSPSQRDRMPFFWRVRASTSRPFWSIRSNSPGDAAYASRPVIDAVTIRDRKFRLVICTQVLLIAIVEGVSASEVCLALPKIFPNGTSDMSRL